MISLKMVGLIGLWSSLWGCQRTRTVSKLPILRTREMMILNSFERMPMLGTRWLRQAMDLVTKRLIILVNAAGVLTMNQVTSRKKQSNLHSICTRAAKPSEETTSGAARSTLEKKPKGIVTGGYTLPIGTFDCVKYGGKYTTRLYARVHLLELLLYQILWYPLRR